MVVTVETVECTNPAVDELRSRIKKQNTSLDERILNSDPFLARYLHHNGQNVDQAERMLQLYADYHEEHGFDKPSNITFPTEMVKDFPFQLGGRDLENRPIAMIPDATTWNIKKWIERGEEDTLLRFMMDMRLRAGEICLERNVDSGVVIVNVEHFQYSQYFHKKSLMFVIDLLQLVEKIAPGEISRLFVINAPRMLKILFETIRKLVKLNVDVIMFDGNDKRWKEKLMQYFPRDGITAEFGGTLEKYWQPSTLI